MRPNPQKTADLVTSAEEIHAVFVALNYVYWKGDV